MNGVLDPTDSGMLFAMPRHMRFGSFFFSASTGSYILVKKT
jgi:hypothetical protein